jgi:hypothetical protein
MARYFEHRYTVTGAAPLPLDMLRYDGATFVTEDDARHVERANNPMISEVRTPITVTLRRFGPTKADAQRVCWDRWRSFGFLPAREQPEYPTRTVG